MLYASLRFAEAYGLWRGKAWAEWLAAISGAIYVPFEVVELAKKVTALRIASLLVNLLVVGYMLSLLRRRPRRSRRPHVQSLSLANAAATFPVCPPRGRRSLDRGTSRPWWRRHRA
jgi:hypothetical protein